jgi:hypothetical protein
MRQHSIVISQVAKALRWFDKAVDHRHPKWRKITAIHLIRLVLVVLAERAGKKVVQEVQTIWRTYPQNFQIKSCANISSNTVAF